MVAFDQYSSANGTGNLSWTHPGAATINGVLIGVERFASPTPVNTAITYGGTTIPELGDSPAFKDTGELAVISFYFLGTGLGSLGGNQTVSITVSAGGTKLAFAITLTASADTEVVTSDGTSLKSDAVTDPSATLALSGRTCFVAEMLMGGAPNVSGITPFTNWTGQEEIDAGALVGGVYTYDIVSTSDVTIGWTQNDEDALGYAVAISEVAGLSATVEQVAETDTAQALTSAKAKAVSQVTEGDLAQAVTPVRIYAISQVVEADLSQSMTVMKSLGLAQATESDVAQTITRNPIAALIGQAQESDLSQSVTSAKVLAITQVSESDLAQAISRNPLAQLILQAMETDLAQALTSLKSIVLGQATEAEIAQALTALKALGITQVTETDLAQTITGVLGGLGLSATVNQVSETDVAQALTSAARRFVGQVAETDLAQNVLTGVGTGGGPSIGYLIRVKQSDVWQDPTTGLFYRVTVTEKGRIATRMDITAI